MFNWKKIGIVILIMIIIIIATVCIRTLNNPSNQIKEVPKATKVTLNPNHVANRLSGALKYKTVSSRDPRKFEYDQFLKLHSYLETAFPKVHQKLKLEKVNDYSLLYTWKGTDSSLQPLLLTAHMDVVNVENETINNWLYPPFSGEIADGKVWGRGARDNKSQMLAILESVEYLLDQGIQPKRTILIAFGHDEEVLGVNGAKKIAEILKSRKITPECMVDEGGAIVEKVIPGIKRKVAIVATSEKGYLTLELSVKRKAGHSSGPEDETSIGILCKAVSKLEANKFPTTLREVKPMLTYATAEMKFPYNFIFNNLWLTENMVKKIMLNDAETSAMLRTTIAPTIIQGGFQDNVIPATAKAIINLRLLPQDTIENTINKVKIIINDPRVKITKVGFSNNAPLPSSTETKSFRIVCTTIKQVFTDAVCIPYFDTGGTDTKHYTDLTSNIYRFTPSIKEKDETGHGMNERIPIKNYIQYIEFYVNLINNFDNY